jgi:hypothetical protein
LYHHTCCCALDVDINHAGLHFRFGNDSLHLGGDVVEAVAGGGGYGDGLLQCIYLSGEVLEISMIDDRLSIKPSR